MRQPAIAVLLEVTALLIMAGCAGLRGLETPEVVVTSIRALDATTLEQRFEVGLRIYNPNNRDLKIDGVDFELDVNGMRLARGAGAVDLVLPRLGEAETTVRASTSVLDIARQVMAAGRSETLSYTLSGRIHLGSGLGGSLPFSKSGELSQAR
jgi:LEA14-like dessication related protein